MTENFWLRRYWQVFPRDPRRRWCLPCGEWFVGRNDCPLCGGALVIEQVEKAAGCECPSWEPGPYVHDKGCPAFGLERVEQEGGEETS